MQKTDAIVRYTQAIVVAFAAILVRKLLNPAMGHENPYHTVWLAVIVSAWICGLGPAVVTTLIGALGVWFWLLPGGTSPAYHSEQQIFGMIGFLVFSSVIIALGESNRRGAITRSKLAAIVQSSDDAIISKNLDGIITSWNRSAEHLFGYTAQEAIGKHITLIIPPERRTEEEVIINKIRNGIHLDHFETVRRAKDGRPVEVSLTISPVKDSSGEIVGASKVARDITEQRRAQRELSESQQRLRKTEKLAAAGQLAASLAHEINNPLSSVTNSLYLLNRNSLLDDENRNLLAIARTELTRMSRIVKQSLSYYRVDSVPKNLDLAATVRESLQVFSDKLERSGIQVITKIVHQGCITGFPDEIRQVIDNLLLNAVEAMPDGGTLSVSVRSSRDWKNGFRNGIRLTMADSGSGIPKEVVGKIFEPFFTTKSERGTGLGLWVVRGIIAKHEGTLRVRSSVTPGKSGTVFSLFWSGDLVSPNRSSTFESVSLV